MSFLPENYEPPRSSNFYFKIQDGENRIRILTAPVLGWEDWQEKKPIRFTYDNKPQKSIDPKKPVRHFWAFVVYNYADQKIQIMHITQATIRKAIEGLCKDSDWGDPYNYDIKVLKSGEGVDTEYSVNPVPHKPVDPSIIEMFNENRCNLNALFTCDDPFALHWEEYTPLGVSGNKVKIKKTISQERADKLVELLSNCTQDYTKKLWATLSKPPLSIQNISMIPEDLFDKIETAALNNQKEKIDPEEIKDLEDQFEEAMGG